MVWFFGIGIRYPNFSSFPLHLPVTTGSVASCISETAMVSLRPWLGVCWDFPTLLFVQCLRPTFISKATWVGACFPLTALRGAVPLPSGSLASEEKSVGVCTPHLLSSAREFFILEIIFSSRHSIWFFYSFNSSLRFTVISYVLVFL